jgi:hypothetical protein
MAAVSGYFTTQNAVTVSGRTWKANEYGDIMANDSVTATGADSLLDSSEVQLRATQKVVINSGFFVANKGKLTVTTGSGALAKRAAGSESKGGYQPTIAIAKAITAFDAKAFIMGKSLRISFSLPEASPVSFTVSDLAGRILTRKSIGTQGAGQYEHAIDLRDAVASKVYFVRVETLSHSKSIKLVMLR